MRLDTNWNTSLSLKSQKKDRFYLNQEVPGPSRKFGPIGTSHALIGTSHAPFSTPTVPNGPLGCQVRV